MIKNSNDLLGVLIKNKNSNNDVSNNELIEISEMDPYSLKFLLNQLIDKGYVIYTMDTTTVTSLGINNYNSNMKRFVNWISPKLIIAAKEIIIFVAGALSTLLINYISHINGW